MADTLPDGAPGGRLRRAAVACCMRAFGMTPSAAVVIGAHVNGLGVARSLAALGIEVACLSTRPFDIAHVSRAVTEPHGLAGAHDDPEVFVDFLRQNASRWRGRAVFPTSDDALRCLARHHEELSRSYILTFEPWERIRTLLEKDAMHDLAKSAGLDVPHCYGTTEDVVRSDVPLRYPVVVKPVRHDRLIDRLGRKAFLARDATELAEASATVRDIRCPSLVFEYVPGEDSELFIHCLYMDAAGEPSSGATVQKVRQNPPGIGSARVARLVEDPCDLREASIALLRAAAARGPAYVEFKRDARTGAFRFIEVNCRAALYNSLPAAAGIDLVRSSWQDFVLGGAVRNEDTGWRGYWIQLQADLACSALFGRQEGLDVRSFLAPYRSPHIYAVLSPTDPQPFLRQSALAVRRAANAPLARLRKKSWALSCPPRCD